MARDFFAGDLLAIAQDRLANPHEENGKQLLRVGEHFALRGPEIDKLNLDSLAADGKQRCGLDCGASQLAVVRWDISLSQRGHHNL